MGGADGEGANLLGGVGSLYIYIFGHAALDLALHRLTSGNIHNV